MDEHRRRPSNMGQLCRLCLTEDAITLPIFGEEESSSQSQIPLSFRIMACVSVEVTQGDGLPAVICEKCLNHVNTWHEFKQVCDISQATLKEWLNSCRETSTIGDKDIYIKQEPLDEEEEEDEEVLEVIDQDIDEQYMVDYIKQEVDSFEEERQGCESVETVHEDSNDPLCVPELCMSEPDLDKDFHTNDDIEIIPIPQPGDVSHLLITDIKTESNNTENIDEVTVTPSPSEGRLLRSVLQGKTRASSYIRSSANIDVTSQEFPPIKPYHCLTCGKSFAYNYLLKRHNKIHTTDKNTCSFCHKGFSSYGALVQHVQLWNENGTVSKKYSCDHCNEKFECRTQYLMHADGSDGSNCIANHDHIVTEDGSYKCEECLNDFPSVMLLRLHMRKEHLHFSCHKCNKVFSNGVSLSNHLRSHSSNIMRHYCEKCPISFTTSDLLRKHEKTHMKEAAAMAVIPQEVVTNSSEYSILSDSNELPQEPELPMYESIKQEPPDSPEVLQVTPDPVKIVSTSYSHVCQVCNEDFPTLASLRFHLKGVHLHYQCHRCPKVFSSGVALSNHLRSHSSVTSSVKKHKCLVCLKTFNTVDLLMKHKKTHNKPRKLPVSEDLLLAVTENELAISTFENNEDNDDMAAVAKRTCSLCNAVLASPSALERHMTTHNKDKLFTCKVCNASMTYASSLQKHYRVMHGQVVVLKSIQKNSAQKFKDTETAKNNDENISTPSETQVAKIEVPQQSECFTRSGRRILSFNRTFQVTPQIQPTRLPTPFECKICHRGFAYRSFLLKHNKVHEKQNALSHSGVSCPICLKTFADAKTLNNHKGVHTRFKHYGCTICGKSFNGLNAWRKHERMHQKGFIYSCKLCGKKFLSKAELHNHKKMHIKLKIYTCSVCKNSYHSSSALGKHKKRHNHYSASAEETDLSDVEVVETKETPVNVPVSKPQFSKPTPVKSTLKQTVPRSASICNPASRQIVPKSLSHFPSGKRRPFCALCNKMFSNVRALKRHKLMHDRAAKPLSVVGTSSNPPVPDTSENTCLTCNRVFPDHTSLVRHKGWHTRRFNFPVPAPAAAAPDPMLLNPCFVKSEPSTVNTNQCRICYRSFNSQHALDGHMKAHSTLGKINSTVERSAKVPIEEKNSVLNSPRRLACKICKKPFESKKALITHIGWHSRGSHSLKPLLSTVKAQTVASALSVGDKFSCNVCHKFFSSAVMLNKHKKLHTRKLLSSIKVKSAMLTEPGADCDGDYSCPVCLRTFKFVKYLNLHMRLHTGEKRFKCNMCNQAYHRSGSLWKHKRTHHAFKVFCCHICQKRFGVKNQLTKHMESHGVPNMVPTVISKTFTVYACSFCDKTFAKLEKLRQHERIHRA